jgi:hypothetical protein
MLKKIRIKLADLFLDMAIRLDFEMVLMFVMDARDLIDAQIAKQSAQEHLERVFNAINTPTKRGRPAGSKDKKPRQATLDAPKRKVGRPLGSKDKKPRVAREGVKLGRPKGRKDSVGKALNGSGHA